MFFVFDRNLFQVFRVFWGFQVFGCFGGRLFGGFRGCLGCGRLWEHSRGFSLSLSPIGAGVTGPLSGPVSDRESVGRIRLCVGVLAGLSV